MFIKRMCDKRYILRIVIIRTLVIVPICVVADCCRFIADCGDALSQWLSKILPDPHKGN